jgi:hypothetical protein
VDVGSAGTVAGVETISEAPATRDRSAVGTGSDAPRLGSRLWLYTNFDCNLACDYCCAESAPRPAAGARRLGVDVASRAVEEFAGLGGRRSCSPAASRSCTATSPRW